MGDDEVKDDPETQDSPESEEEPTGGEATDDAEEAEVEEPERETEEEEGEEGARSKAGPSAYEKLLAKYGGDKEKLAEAYWEQARSGARLHERLSGIEDFLRGQQQQPKVDEAKLVAEDPDIKGLKEEISSVQAEIKGVDQEQSRLISEYGKLEERVANLKGQLEAADPEQKPAIEARLMRAASDQRSVYAEIRATQRDRRALDTSLRGLQRQERETESRVKAGLNKQRIEALEAREDAQNVRQEFFGAMQEEAEKYGVDPKSRQFAVLFENVYGRIYSYLTRLPEDAPAVDIPGAVEALMAEHAEMLGLKSKFQRASTVKRQATSEVVKGRTETVRPSGKAPKTWTKQYVDERAKRLLGG